MHNRWAPATFATAVFASSAKTGKRNQSEASQRKRYDCTVAVTSLPNQISIHSGCRRAGTLGRRHPRSPTSRPRRACRCSRRRKHFALSPSPAVASAMARRPRSRGLASSCSSARSCTCGSTASALVVVVAAAAALGTGQRKGKRSRTPPVGRSSCCPTVRRPRLPSLPRKRRRRLSTCRARTGRHCLPVRLPASAWRRGGTGHLRNADPTRQAGRCTRHRSKCRMRRTTCRRRGRAASRRARLASLPRKST